VRSSSGSPVFIIPSTYLGFSGEIKYIKNADPTMKMDTAEYLNEKANAVTVKMVATDNFMSCLFKKDGARSGSNIPVLNFP
jgi:hypothetical protein